MCTSREKPSEAQNIARKDSKWYFVQESVSDDVPNIFVLH